MLYEAPPAVASGKPSVETLQTQPAVAANLTVAAFSKSRPSAATLRLLAQRSKATPMPRPPSFLASSRETAVRLRSLNDESYEISNLNNP